MKRIKLKSNSFLKKRTEENWKRYTKQRHFRVSLLRKTNSVNEKNITDNRKFLKTLKPMLSNNSITNEKIISVEGEILSNNDDFE